MGLLTHLAEELQRAMALCGRAGVDGLGPDVLLSSR